MTDSGSAPRKDREDARVMRLRAHIEELKGVIEKRTAALERARRDIVEVNAAGFDSTRGELAVAAITQIDDALA